MPKGKDLKKEWIAFLETGSERAYYDLYDHYHDYLVYIGSQKGISMEKIKDSINDLFLYVFENRSRLQRVINHHNYFVTVFLRNLFRKNAFDIDESLILDDEHLPDMPSYPSIEAIHIQQNVQEEVSQTLKRYMTKLSAGQEKMIYQKFYLGLTYNEIAIANSVSVKTVYNTILQAVAKLRKLLGPDEMITLAAAISLLSAFILFFLRIL